MYRDQSPEYVAFVRNIRALNVRAIRTAYEAGVSIDDISALAEVDAEIIVRILTNN